MSRGCDHQHDIVAGQERSYAMDDQRGSQGPARMGFLLDAREFLLGHAGIVFEGQGEDFAGAFRQRIAHGAGEGDDGPHVRAHFA